MKWGKKGLIYGPDGSLEWAKHTALTPTPILLNDKEIRIYTAFKDELGIGRIGFVDVEAANPSKVLRVSRDPVLDIGEPGAFDDNGVILGEVIRDENTLYMFYMGFQLAKNVKFLAFTGLAACNVGQDQFTRLSRTPILDRSDEARYIRVIHSVIRENASWRMYYSSGNSWQIINERPYPSYHIRCIQSSDLFALPKEGKLCLDLIHPEYRIGRSRVWHDRGTYKMLFTRGTITGYYSVGYAESPDGFHWARCDDAFGLKPSKSGWDSNILYPTLFRYRDRTYVFYNGDNLGHEGFGYAELEE